MDFQLDTGLILNCIIGDVKSSGDPNYSEWGHLYPPNSISVIESVVKYSKWYPSHANPGTPGCKPEWAGNVVLALNYGNYWEIDPPGGIDMASVIIISATKKGGVENAYIGTIGNDGYIYFNDIDFYRFKNHRTWEDNVYVLNRTRRSWTKTTMFTKISAQNLNSGSGSVAPGGSGVEGACLWAWESPTTTAMATISPRETEGSTSTARALCPGRSARTDGTFRSLPLHLHHVQRVHGAWVQEVQREPGSVGLGARGHRSVRRRPGSGHRARGAVSRRRYARGRAYQRVRGRGRRAAGRPDRERDIDRRVLQELELLAEMGGLECCRIILHL